MARGDLPGEAEAHARTGRLGGEEGVEDAFGVLGGTPGAQQNRAVPRHDAFLAQGAVLAAAGGLESHDLAPGEALYYPAAHFDQVKGRGGAPWDGAVEAVDGLGAPAEQ